MTRVLLIGIAPDAVDVTDPALPPGLTREKIAEGIASTLDDMRGRGWEADFCALRPDSIEPIIEKTLSEHSFDVVVVGAGIRMPPNNLLMLERVINAVLRGAPGAAIAFNTRPENTGDAAARWLGA